MYGTATLQLADYQKRKEDLIFFFFFSSKPGNFFQVLSCEI